MGQGLMIVTPFCNLHHHALVPKQVGLDVHPKDIIAHGSDEQKGTDFEVGQVEPVEGRSQGTTCP